MSRDSSAPSAPEITECKVCGAEARLFDVVDLQKTCNGQPESLSGVPIYYLRCTECDFIFTSYFDDFDAQQWRTVIYDDEYYHTIDPDYAETRPRWNAVQIGTVLPTSKRDVVGFDYGGGNGRTAEILREQGLAYDSYDPYGVTSMTPGREQQYNVCSAFEVAEHTIDPRGMMADILRLASPGPLIVLLGTLVHDDDTLDPVRLNWWYAAPRNGHVSLFSRKSLSVLAELFGLSLISFNASQHVFFRGHARSALRRRILANKIRHRLVGVLPGRR